MQTSAMDVQGKGLWSEVVRRKEASTSVKSVEDGMKDMLILSGAVSEAAGTSQPSPEAMAASALNADAGAKPSGGDVSAICNGERGASAEIVADDFEMVAADLIPEGAANLSPTSLKSAWKNSSKPLNDSCDGAVMGSEFWPSLADSRTMKSTKSFQSDRSYNSTNDKSEKDLLTATFSADQQNIDIDNGLGNVHLRHRKIEANKERGDAASSISTIALLPIPIPPIVVSDMVEQRPFHPLQQNMPEARAGSSASGNTLEQGQSFNQRSNNHNMLDDALAPRRNRNGGISGRGGMSHRQWNEHGYSSAPGGMQNRSGSNRFYPQYERAPRQRGNGGPSHSNFGNRSIFRDQGRGNNNWQPQQFYADGPNHAQRFQQPNFDPILWNVPNFFHPNFGYINCPVHEGIYYPLVKSPGFSQGAGYSAPFEAPPAPAPASQDTSPLSLLAKQIEYYFSNENLVKDAFLRSRMDAEGFVSASLISSFNLIRKQNADTDMILEALQNSAIVEVQGDKLRSRYYWQLWLPSYPQNSSILGSGSSSTVSNYSPSANISRSSELTNSGGSAVDVVLELFPNSNIDPEHFI